MDGDLITVEVLINGILFKPTLINTGCEYYSIMDKDLITKLRLLRVKIPLKLIIDFIKENIKEPGVEITKSQNSPLISKGIGEIYSLMWCLYY